MLLRSNNSKDFYTDNNNFIIMQLKKPLEDLKEALLKRERTELDLTVSSI